MRQELGGAAATMAIAICAPATDAADNTETSCVTPCFIHKADCNAPCRVLVRVCQHGGNWLTIFFSFFASYRKLTLTYWSCKPHSVSLISLPRAWLSPCLSLHHVYLSIARRLSSSPSLPLPSLSPSAARQLSKSMKKDEQTRRLSPNSFLSPMHSRLLPRLCLSSTCYIPPPLLPHRIKLKWEMYCFLHSLKSKSNWVNLSDVCLLGSNRLLPLLAEMKS